MTKKIYFVISLVDVEVAESEVGVQGEQEAHLITAKTFIAVADPGGVACSGKFLCLK